MGSLPVLSVRAGRSPEPYYINPQVVRRVLNLRVEITDIRTMRTLLLSLTFIAIAFSESPPLDTCDSLPYCNGQSEATLPLERDPCSPQEEKLCCISFTKYICNSF